VTSVEHLIRRCIRMKHQSVMVAFTILLVAVSSQQAEAKADPAAEVMTRLANRSATKTERLCGLRIVGTTMMSQLAASVTKDSLPPDQSAATGRIVFECLPNQLLQAMQRGFVARYSLTPLQASCVAAKQYRFQKTVTELRTAIFDTTEWSSDIQRRAIQAISPCVPSREKAEALIRT
jgi:hypothetical protein